MKGQVVEEAVIVCLSEEVANEVNIFFREFHFFKSNVITNSSVQRFIDNHDTSVQDVANIFKITISIITIISALYTLLNLSTQDRLNIVLHWFVSPFMLLYTLAYDTE